MLTKPRVPPPYSIPRPAVAVGLVPPRSARLGNPVALVERDLMGGDCLNVSCVPSKALIRAARAWADVRGAGDFGVTVPPGVRVAGHAPREVSALAADEVAAESREGLRSELLQRLAERPLELVEPRVGLGERPEIIEQPGPGVPPD